MNCPVCRDVIDDGDWFYNNNLYDPEGDDTKVNCPKCDSEFMAKSYASIEIDCCTIEDYEEYGEIL